MRRFILLTLFSLAACASPQERCISEATKELRVLDRLIAVTQANLDRGYAIETKEYFDTEVQACGKVKGKTVYCDVPVAETREVPVAIDLNAEQAKLDSLLSRRNEMAVLAAAGIEACKARYGEG